ncbi:TPA: hypothetical protein LAM98_004237 [Escherichia coli]|nr:hypothetical protein [Escherichia coli]HBJ0322936.1 hypothetical protein [Escherichia coli]HBJ0442081.1 hypothetical protein [Escherichia coli]
MATINKCENIVFIPEFTEDDRPGYHAVLDYCMVNGVAFEYLQNARGQHFVLVIGDDKHLKEVLNLCVDFGLKGSIKPNKVCKSK